MDDDDEPDDDFNFAEKGGRPGRIFTHHGAKIQDPYTLCPCNVFCLGLIGYPLYLYLFIWFMIAVTGGVLFLQWIQGEGDFQ